MSRIPSSAISVVSLACIFLGAYSAEAQPKKLGIRFTAASFFIQQDNQENRPLDILKSSAGFDVIFRTQYFDDQTYYMTPGGASEMLKAAGTTTLRESADAFGHPGATCDGNLRYDPNYPAVLRGQDVTQDGPIKTVKIQIPGINNNTHSGVGLLSDPSQVYFACITPQIGTYVGGSNVEQTFVWEPTGNMIPEDANPDSAGLVRGTNAVFQFDIRNLPVTVPLKFKRESRVFDDKGKILDEQKHVWFGQVYIFDDTGQSFAPIDPLTFLGYTPPVGVNDFPNDPPVKTTPPTKDEWNNWLSNITDAITNHLNNVSQRWQQILGGAPARNAGDAVLASTDVFNLAQSTATLSDLPAPPANATLEVHIVFRDPKKVKGFKPTIAKAALDNAVTAGQPSTIGVLFDAKAKKALSSSKAFTAFVVVRATAADGSGVFEKIKKFKKPKRTPK